MRWRILALLFLARTALGVQFQALGSASDGLSAAFGLGNAEIGLMIGLFMAPGLFLALPAGAIGHLASDRTLAGGGLAVLALGGVISASAGDATFVGLGRVVAGVGFLFSTLYFTKMVADWFEGREIATAMSVLVMSWPFGIAMGQVGHTFLAEAFGWRVPFVVASAYCLAMSLAVLVLYSTPAGTSVRGAARLSGFLSRRELALVLLGGLAWGLFNAGYVVYLSFGPAALEAAGATPLAAASVISLGSWVMILSGALCGHLADRTGRRDVILLVCMTAAMLSLFMLTKPGLGLAASLTFGLLGMAPAGVIMALAGQAVGPERRALGMGLFLTVYYALLSAVPAIAGRIADVSGSPTAALGLAMALFGLVLPATLLFGWIQRKRDVGIGKVEGREPSGIGSK